MNNNFYLAVVLDDKSIEKLKNAIKPKHSNIFYHHMTVAYKPTEEAYRKYEPLINSNINLKVIKHCFDNKGQAVLVDTELSENEYPHITLSCSEGVAPIYSNDLFKGCDSCEEIILDLEGKLELVSLS